MKLLTKAALCAAVLACPAVAPAAQFVRYDFTATGFGTQTTCSSQPCTESSFTQMQFSFIAPTMTGNFSTSGSVFGPGKFGAGVGTINVGPTQVALAESADALSGSATLSGICNEAAGSFVPVADPTASTCGSVAYNNNNLRDFRTEFYGKVTAVDFSFFLRDSDAPAGLVFASPGVPEPSTWALMLAGFGLTGYALRRRRSQLAFG